MKRSATLLCVLGLTTTLFGARLDAAGLPCAPCGGVEVDDVFAALPTLGAGPRLDDEARLYVAYDLPLGSAVTPAAAHALAAQGLRPWVRFVFRTAAPLTGNLQSLQLELDAAAAVAASRPPSATFQIVWRPADGGTAPSAAEVAFLIKRASVALTGADPDATVFVGPLPEDPDWLSDLYSQDVAAYLDGVTLAPGEGLSAAVDRLRELDPGKPIVLDGAPWPAPSRRVLSAAAAAKEAGCDVALFRAPADGPDAEGVAALRLLANEFHGDLALDPGTRPTGGAASWSFVRGDDLSLHVVAVPADGSDELVLRFPDPQLKSPVALIGSPPEVVPIGGFRRTGGGVEVRLADPEPAVVLRLERASIAELEGVAEEVTVETGRQMPVEEILRRLQAFEDSQNRRIRHWQAVNTTTLRFQAASGVQAVEATFEGDVFFRPGQPFDWAWQNFYFNGVRWTGKKIPEIPLVQPEKAAAMPLEILFTKEYRYSLRGNETVNGRDCWVVDFEPAVAVESGRTLFRGTVWVDRQTYARVQTRAIQLGLQGEVLSNEETISYRPVDASGAAVDWSGDAFVLPLRTTGQQILSVLNTATVVERQVDLSHLAINGDDFDSQREKVLASTATMVRDTDKGLRYLVADENAPGERVVKEGYDTSKLFLLGGVFYDDSLDYPLPLAGVNYFDLNFHGGERQFNAFFGGVLGIVNYADPHLFGSKVDLGVDVFGLAIATSDQLYRDGLQSSGEEVKELPERIRFNLGFPIGSFVKVSTAYRLAYSKFSSTDATADDFVLPSDNLTHQLELGVQFARGGYRLNLQSAFAHRSKWEPWGAAGNTEFDLDAQDYTTWGATLAKNWYFPGFRKLGLEVGYLDGSHLDRFSKYQFGFFGDTRVHGYQIGKVRAEKAYLAHATYGFELGSLLRLDAVGDAAWATDKTSGLDNELLAGVGLAGTFQGPWETLVQIDLGTPVAGPDSGVVAYVVFLKLFD